MTQTPLGEDAARGAFVAPTLIEVSRIADVEREVFGPVLHVLRYRREALDALIDDINAAGYGLTFGLHTRIDETIARVVERIEAGNIYVNRNVIGATVGVQPFGGSRLSGTGPKAGGPLYLSRLARRAGAGRAGRRGRRRRGERAASAPIATGCARRGHAEEAERCVGMMARSPLGARAELKGPVGERNVYALRRRGRIAAVAAERKRVFSSRSARSWRPATTRWSTRRSPSARFRDCRRSSAIASRVSTHPLAAPALAFALLEGDEAATVGSVAQARRPRLARSCGFRRSPSARIAAGEDYNLADLVEECATATNTAAAGGNASLMTIG